MFVNVRVTRASITVQDTTYRAADAIDVRLHDLRKVGPAIDTALAHGITEISTIRFEASDVSGAQESALREATERARRQAAAIAEASGGRLGRTLSLSTERESASYPYDLGLSFSGAGASGGLERGTEVIEPAIKVRVTVYGKWELLVRP